MKRKVLSLFSALLIAVTVFAQTPSVRKCGTMENLDMRKSEDPGLAARMQQIEAQTAAYLQAHKYDQNTTNGIITIPVVFHIVYSSSSQNISDAQCQAQISQLNLDFARLNADRVNTPSAWSTVAASTNIQFCLAQRDPSGNATTGIERRSTTVSSWSTNDNVKFNSQGGLNAWPSSSYLNIWSCNLSNGILGYAQFPGGSSSTDGVVLLFSSIGSVARPGTASPYNLGRTATHEVGHWLNLYHIWGDDGGSCSGTDAVGDTPNQAGENYGCPTFPKTDNCSSSSPGVMFMNYMDYTNDGCMNMFTSGQSTRMSALFATGGSRAALTSSLGCVPPSISACGTPTGLIVSSVSGTSATISWTAVSGALSYNVTYTTNSGVSATINTTSATANLTGLTAGTTYNVQVVAVCSGSTSSAATASFTTTASVTCGTPGSLTSSSVTSSGATLSWSAVSGASSYSVSYSATGGSAIIATSTTTSLVLTGLAPSTTYNWQVRATCTGGAGAFSSLTSFTTSASTTVCTDPYESNNSSSAARTISTNTDIRALISSSTDRDWFRFSTTTPNTNIRIALTNLAADYDIRLYNSSLSQLAISQNSGTTSETIIRNTTTAATYFIQVYGYNGAFNANGCYTLRVNAGSSTYRTDLNSDELQLEKIEANDFVVYPNPARESINIDFNSGASEIINARIFDMMGKSVLNQEVNVNEGMNKFGFDLSELSKGIYFIEINSTIGRQVKKFLIEK